MQYHLNGYVAGDPSIDPTLKTANTDQPDLPLPNEVDVLIVGCGPAGLALAAQLSVFESIKVCIVDQKTGPLQVGQADGIACRTMEMFQTFGFADRVLKEAYWVNETAFWKPHTTNKQHIARQGKVQDTEDGLSEFPHVILNQARVHDFFLEFMQSSVTNLVPHYGKTLRSVVVQNDNSGKNLQYPVKASFQAANANSDQTSQSDDLVCARYVVGCDGARSAVRESLGLSLKGDSVNQAWGVMDVLAVTTFPDIRIKCLIQSVFGSVVLIPREGGYLFRLYVELGELGVNERVKASKITVEELIAKAKIIFEPYTLEVKEIVWWSVYQIGQRLCDRFDDVAPSDVSNAIPRVFIAGDACHTHSPKAGQGMNVSMQDSFNLGWKLASVIQGRSRASILHTYSIERQAVASELIEFDQRWAKMVSSTDRPVVVDDAPGQEKVTSGNSLLPSEALQQNFIKHAHYTAGTSIQYRPSIICAANTYQHLASGFEIGKRFHSVPVIRLSDTKPVELGHVVQADGRWRLFLFSDSVRPDDGASCLSYLCELLHRSEASPLRRYTGNSSDIDSLIDVRAVFQQSDIEITSVPELLFPAKGRYGLHDYEKCFCVDYKSGADVYKMRGIDTTMGCMIIVRPDQFIAGVLPLDKFDDVAAFFDAFMIP